MGSPFIVNIVELLRRPGTKKDLALSVPASQFDFDDSRIPNDSLIDVDLHLESLTNGIIVHGVLGGQWKLKCRRCLRLIGEASEAVVDELFQRIPDNPDAFPLGAEQLDLRPMVRELILLSEPRSSLCSADCPGLCPQCGADLQSSPCHCEARPVDERWAVLDELRQQLGD